MRIIAGKFKGRALITMKDRSIRPTTDRVKESVFNLIQNRVEGAKVLDLFCGSGALGIECISRGAENVTFCDRAADSLATTKANLEKVSGDYSFVNSDYMSAIDRLARQGAKFDLIFLDPPYAAGYEETAFAKIASGGLLAEGGLIILERARGEKRYKLPFGMAITDSRDYGGTTVDIIEYARKAALTGTFDPFTNGHFYLAQKALEAFDVLHVVVLVNPEKQTEFSVEKRLRLIKQAVRKLDGRVVVDFYSGLAIDYCHLNDIQYIIRGVRNEKDFAYETEMAVWNKEHGNVETLLIPAENCELSSTLVREKLAKGEDVAGLIDDENLINLTVEEKKWKI